MKDIAKIKKQLEFYFSDANYAKDKFLREKCSSGGIDIDILLTFKKLKELECNAEDIKNVLKDSGLVKIDGNKISKIESEEYKKYIESNTEVKTVIIKGFEKTMDLGEIENYISKYFIPSLIRMRKDKNKKFNGNIMVELKNEEEAKKVLGMKIEIPNKEVGVETDEDGKKRKVEKTENKKVKLENDKIKENKQTEVNDKIEKTEDKNIKSEGTENKSEESKYLQIMMKRDYLDAKKEGEKKEKIKNTLLKEFKNKIFKFTTEKEMTIKEIKNIVEGVAFVDLKENVLRFKKEQGFTTKEYTSEEGDKITLNKLEEDKEMEYIQKLKIEKPIKKKKNKKF
ncbi:La domain protein [Spraguea lophii 42_110]|uniref:La domain protein n=1 Tax=Spraguea lophii (strain 42_110) TaxID=1358809 RepID=S7WC36_SPRLO|nr:La domain protein [Spraguea lophii 42_110]